MRKEVIFREVVGRKGVMPFIFQEMMRRGTLNVAGGAVDADGGGGEDGLDGSGEKDSRCRFRGGGLTSGDEDIFVWEKGKLWGGAPQKHSL